MSARKVEPAQTGETVPGSQFSSLALRFKRPRSVADGHDVGGPLRARESYRQFHDAVQLAQAEAEYVERSLVGAGPSVHALADQSGHFHLDVLSGQRPLGRHELAVHEIRAVQQRSADLQVAHANLLRPPGRHFLDRHRHHDPHRIQMKVGQLHRPRSFRKTRWWKFVVERAQATSRQSLGPIRHGILSAGVALFQVSLSDTVQVTKSVGEAIPSHGILGLERLRAHSAKDHLVASNEPDRRMPAPF